MKKLKVTLVKLASRTAIGSVPKTKVKQSKKAYNRQAYKKGGREA